MSGLIEIPRMLFRGRKVYLERTDGGESDDFIIERLADFIEHYTGVTLQDNAFYHEKAKQTLGIS